MLEYVTMDEIRFDRETQLDRLDDLFVQLALLDEGAQPSDIDDTPGIISRNPALSGLLSMTAAVSRGIPPFGSSATINTSN